MFFKIFFPLVKSPRCVGRPAWNFARWSVLGRILKCWSKILGGCTPKKFQGPKTCKIEPDFGRLRSSVAIIFETDENIQNQIVIPSMAITPALRETRTVKFGPVTLEISMLNRTHLKCIFRKTVFQPLRGAALPNFYTRERMTKSN